MKSLILFLSLVSVVAMVFSVPAAAEKMRDPNNPVIVMQTSMGDMEIELYTKEAPISVQNFLWYVNNEFYDGLVFHRVMDHFMIQGGGFTPDMKKKAGNPPIENEAKNGLSNDKYTLSMARLPAVHSASSQFFINNQDNPSLNYVNEQRYGYAVFGKVIVGQEVVDKISKVEVVTKNGMQNVPAEPVIIKKVFSADGKKAKKKKKSE